MHGQWDWMNDPEIHSSNWEWDTAQPAEQWKHSHNYVHHQFTNVLGYDNDIGYGILRMAREQKWSPFNLGQPVYNALLASALPVGRRPARPRHRADPQGREGPEGDEAAAQADLRARAATRSLKDYVVYPALSGPQWKTTMAANATANLARNLWAYVIIFCGHFPDGALHFTEEEIEDETRAEWYLRQILGAANFKGGPLLHIMSGNLGFQIEHHLFPDLPSNRYAEISVKVRALCDEVRHPLHDRPAAPAVRPGAAHDHEAVAAQRLDLERPARAARARRVARGASPTPSGRPGVPSSASGRAAGRASGRRPDAHRGSAGSHDRRWVTQCALSRICGGCAMSLGRPVAFLGTPDEVGRNAFHLPPLHVACAEELRRAPGRGPDVAAGHDVRLRVRPAQPRGPRPGAEVRAQLAHRWVPAIGCPVWMEPERPTTPGSSPPRRGLVVHDVQGRGRRPAAARLPGRVDEADLPAQRDRRPLRVAHGAGRLGAAGRRRRAEAGGGRHGRGVRARPRTTRSAAGTASARATAGGSGCTSRRCSRRWAWSSWSTTPATTGCGRCSPAQ